MIQIAPSKFDINTKPLHKAKPCITELIRDDGSTEWFENCKAGQLLEIKSGDQKAYINLDYTKLLNLNINTSEEELEKSKKVIEIIETEKKELRDKIEGERIKLEEELKKIEQQEKIAGNREKKKEKAESQYKKRIDGLRGKWVKLTKNKLKNFGTVTKPILGFVCYEKEFNALPYKAEHDSKAITQWMDDILKNKKDFQAQRTEAFGKMGLLILFGVALVIFIIVKWGAPVIEAMNKETVEVAVDTVAEIPILLPILSKRVYEFMSGKLSAISKSMRKD